ncbi:hypothetical protein [Frigoribacterium sp. Leaf172]|uniref:DUF6993 domain-containing protein n=1 Tax=Frigoribacterium sp. Leaf172 TaxID=1736285 RepID=UPI0006F71F52|nr:hypothetical protein [Frigoribacterium sp. Leaf172]KQR66623.1 hypothetical protein ASF89_06145 [Frigoribacterium sp. Leaf172]
MIRSRLAPSLGALFLLALGTAGCTSGPGTVQPSVPPTPSADAAAPTTPAADASIDEALAYFDRVNREHLDGGGATDGRSLVDNLVAAGFDKTAMQVTSDTTSIGREADSIQFSVLRGSDCLIGQAGATGYASQVAPVLGTGACLIGTTRTIDW